MLLLAAFVLLATSVVALVQQHHQLKKKKRSDEVECTLEEEEPLDKKSRSYREPDLAVLDGELLDRILAYVGFGDFLSVAAVCEDW
jgi:hypothetical protein